MILFEIPFGDLRNTSTKMETVRFQSDVVASADRMPCELLS